jgi:AcrR family transcriptional regulator
MSLGGHLPKKRQPRQAPGKGDGVRQEIIDRALGIAAVKGLGAVSIGNLAKELKMSKSGLFSHFGSKEKLELAIVEEARHLFVEQILRPVRLRGLKGIARVWGLCGLWLQFLEERILPGDYFFTGALFEYAGQGGPLRKAIIEVLDEWFDALKDAVNEARRRGDFDKEVDASRTAFELNNILIGAQWSDLVARTNYAGARVVILDKLRTIATGDLPAGIFDSVGEFVNYLGSRFR